MSGSLCFQPQDPALQQEMQQPMFPETCNHSKRCRKRYLLGRRKKKPKEKKTSNQNYKTKQKEQFMLLCICTQQLRKLGIFFKANTDIPHGSTKQTKPTKPELIQIPLNQEQETSNTTDSVKTKQALQS